MMRSLRRWWRRLLGKPERLARDLPNEEAVTLGGRSFVAIDIDRRTVLIDHQLMTIIQEAGLSRVLPMDGETDADYLVRMQAALIASGRVPDLLGAYLLPEGVSAEQWTRQIARDTAKYVARLNDPDDRELVLRLAMEATWGFFVRGLVSQMHSRAYSERPDEPAHRTSLH